MLSRLDVITPPTAQVISLQTLKQFVRVDDSSDDAILSGFIDAATDLAQSYLNRVLLTTTLNWTIARTVIPHVNAANSFGWNVVPNTYFPYTSANHHTIELPRSPVQNVISVSRGLWGQSPDTFLVNGTDYYLDLSSTPARMRMIGYGGWTTPPDHLSILYVAGYDQQNTISIAGTATVSGAISATVGEATVSATVSTGDTAQTVAAAFYAALQAAPAAPSANLIAPAMMQLRGANVAVSGVSAPAGLTLTAGNPASSIPAAITNAIMWGAAFLYQNLASPEMQMPTWFYAGLAPYRQTVFA